MTEYRKKPVVIEAMQWDGTWESAQPILEWIKANKTIDRSEAIWSDAAGELYIWTDEGKMQASPGDWVIRGVAGEFYPCKPSIFDATYEPVEARDE